ncbi:MAG: FG-GAP repeat domain-containing protein [Prevotella sp.]
MKKLFFTKRQLAMLAMMPAAMGAMADDSPSWTYYDPFDHGFQKMETRTRTIPTCADFNNDGKLEVVYGGQHNGDWEWFWQYSEAEDWHWGWGWQSEWDNAAYVYGNFSPDSDPQKLASCTGDNVTEPFGIPTSTFSFYRWIDFNNDGNLDLLVCGIQDYNNRGISDEADKHYAFLYENGGEAAGYQFAKLDQFPFNLTDGVPNFNPNNGWYYTDNEQAQHYGAHNRGLSFGDINNDGILDFVSMGKSGGLAIYLGKGDGSFELLNRVTENYNEGDLKLVDFDHDGNLDLVVAGWSDMGYVNFFKGHGDGTFTLTNPEAKRDIRSCGVAVADFNNDGRMDVIIAGYSDNDGWTSDLYTNKGEFQFDVTNNIVPDYVEACVIYPIDVDNDGKMDILLNHGNNLKWFQNNGNGFNGTGYCTDRKSNNSGGGFTFGDIYGDGALDMVIQAKHGDNVYMGTVRGVANTRPAAPTDVKVERAADKQSLTISWKAATDEVTPAKSLLYNVYIQYGNTVRCLVPANLADGSLKVVQDMQTLISSADEQLSATFSIPAEVANADIIVGVQAIDGAYAPSAFAVASVQDVPTSIKQIATEQDAQEYTLSGHAATKSYRGIVIRNGKKMNR